MRRFITAFLSAAIIICGLIPAPSGAYDSAEELPVKMTFASQNSWKLEYPSALGKSCYTDAEYLFGEYSEDNIHGIDYYGLTGDDCVIVQTANADASAGSPCTEAGYKFRTWAAFELSSSAEVYVLSPSEQDATDNRYMNWLRERGFEQVTENEKKAMVRAGELDMFLYKREVYVPEGEQVTVTFGNLGAYINNMYSAVIKFTEVDEPGEKEAWIRNANQLNWAVVNNISAAESLKPWYDSPATYGAGSGLEKYAYEFANVSLIRTLRYESANEPFKTMYKSNTSEMVETIRVNYPCELYVLFPMEARNECGKWLLNQGYEKCETNLNGALNIYVYKKTFDIKKGEAFDIQVGTVNSNWINQMCSFVIRWLVPYSGETDVQTAVSYSYDYETSKIKVLLKGNISVIDKLAGAEMTLSVLDSKNQTVASETGTLDEKGKLSCEFELDYVPGEYTLKAESEKTENPGTAVFTVSDMADIFILLNDLKEKRITEAEALKEILEDEEKNLGIERELYKSLNDSLKLKAAQNIMESLSIYSPEEFKEVFSEKTLFAAINSKDEKTIKAAFELSEDETGIKSSGGYEDFKALSSPDFVYEYLSEKEYQSKAEFITAFEEGTALAGLKTVSNKTQITGILEKYATLFMVDTSSADYKKYKNYINGYVYNRLSEINKPEDVSEIVENAIAEAKKEYAANQTGGGGSGSGGSGRSGSSGGGVSSVKASPSLAEKKVDDIDFSKNISFADVPEDHWAAEPIKELALKGVLSGRGDGMFRPSDNVTRAEFIKMITTAFGYDFTSAEKFFEDVSETDWYFPYVSAGYKKGLIKGTGNGFNPDSSITRQDAFVILKNTMEKTEGEELDFADSEEISGYALEAVSVLLKEKIISGFSDNTIKPKNKITRAEAAQIVYNSLKGDR